MANLVSRETFQRLSEYKDLLLKWNKSINLISKKTEPDAWERHFLDSMQLLNLIQDDRMSVMDIGTGAGFPGCVLSICGLKNISLVESDSRKCAFLFEVSKISENKIHIINDRIENLENIECDILTSRAFGDLDKILRYTKGITVKQKYLLYKGEKYAMEIDDINKDWLFDIKIHDSITSNYGKILEISNVQERKNHLYS